MAEVNRFKFYCDICDKSYDFKSRYDRHLISAGHIQLQQVLCLEQEIQSDPTGTSIRSVNESSTPVSTDGSEHENTVIMQEPPIIYSDVRWGFCMCIDSSLFPISCFKSHSTLIYNLIY